MQFFKQLTDPALKRLYKFVLKRMIGRFLAADELDLDQLDVHLRAGRMELCDLLLNADVLNAELCEPAGLPFRVKKGYLGSVRVAISYANIMSESCLVEIDDIEVVLVPVEKYEREEMERMEREAAAAGGSAARASMAPSASASDAGAKDAEPVDEVSQEGLDFVASWIEQVTSKIKVTLSNICLRLETGEQYNGRYVALVCRLEWAQLTDESAADVQSVYGRNSFDHPAGMYGSQTLGGAQSMAASSLFGISQKGIKFRGITMDLYLSSNDDGIDEPLSTQLDTLVVHPFLDSDRTRQCYVQVKVSHYDVLEAPTVDADVFFHSIRVVLQPQHFPEFGKLIDAFSTGAQPGSTHHPHNAAFGSISMLQSVCDSKPRWMIEEATTNGAGIGSTSNTDGGGLDLSYKEFQRIEQLLMQYRQTHEDLMQMSRRAGSDAKSPTTLDNSVIQPRKLSLAESVESVGLSDLDDEDDFFDCDTGASGLGASASIMGQSMYASARFDADDTDSVEDDRDQSMSRSTIKGAARQSRQLQNRVKLHLLEFQIVLLYDDLPDDDDNFEAHEEEVDLSESQRPAAPMRLKPLPSVDGQERLEITFKDVICSSLVYSGYTIVTLTIGTLEVAEKTLPRMSLDVVEDESAMLTTKILRFTDYSPANGRKVHLSTNLSIQVRIDTKSEEDGNSVVSALSVQIKAQPLLFEWDMYILDRAQRLMMLLEDPSAKDGVALTPRESKAADEYEKKLELTTDCVRFTLRFPMVNSDIIRFGASSARGLCEDRLVVTLEGVKVTSVSSDAEINEDVRFSSDKKRLPWMSEFNAQFGAGKVVLITPEGKSQRSSQVEKSTLFTVKRDDRTNEACKIRFRLQTPSHADIRAAIAAKQNLTQDASQVSDVLSTKPGEEDVDGDDNDGGRVGLNGWSLEAVARTEKFEEFAAASGLFSIDISVPKAEGELLKASLDRLMVLFDALLMINPIDVNTYNQMLSTATLRKRVMASYMSTQVLIAEGSVKICDYVEVPQKEVPASDLRVALARHEENGGKPRTEQVLFTYHFAFEKLKIFQVSQWMSQLVSRVHIAAHNVTLLEEDSSSNVIVPIIYKTPHGVSDAPLLFIGIDIVDQTNDMREMKVELHLSHLSLRYDVRSKWLFQMLDILLLEYPVPIIPLDSASTSPEEYEDLFQLVKQGSYDTVKLAVAPKTVFTKLFVNFYDTLVDYAPIGLTSRMIVVLGTVSVSSNVVSTAIMQGYKITANDMELYLTQSRTSYDDIDDSILGKELFTVRHGSGGRKMVSFAQRVGSGAEYPSLQMFLEKFGFLQLITMDFVDVFLRAVVPPPKSALGSAALEEEKKPAFPELSVELNLGTANIYACFDSFNTFIELLSNWADQLAVEQAPKDTTAYVGLDRVSDASVITNLSPATTTLRPIGTSAMPIASLSISATSNIETPTIRDSLRDSADSHQGGTGILSMIDSNAFGGEKSFFPGGIAATDTEARLLRTRLDSVQKEKERMVRSVVIHDDELSATELRSKYARDDKPKVRINELVIEDYYSSTRAERLGDESPGAFLMEPGSPTSTVAGPAIDSSGDDPWFTQYDKSPSDPHPVGSMPDEQAARWIPPSRQQPNQDENLWSPVSFESAEGALRGFEAELESRPPISTAGEAKEEDEDIGAIQESDEDEYDMDQFPVGAFPAASKNWWGLQTPQDVELSDLQTEETGSSFSHHPGFFDDGESHVTMDSHDIDHEHDTPHALSMSIIDAGEEEGMEVELDFSMDQELQKSFHRLMDLESSDGREAEAMLEEEELGRISETGESTESTDGLDRSRPISMPRKASFSSTTSSQVPSIAPSQMSPPDEPTARWFYDEQQAGGSTPTGPPSRIYPHHVEVPIGGSASSLSFGEKECNDAIKSIARENATRRVDGTPPIVVQRVLLRNFNICMRFFGGNDWTRDPAAEAGRRAKSAPTGSEDVSKEDQDAGSKRKEQLLNALLDNYVPSGSDDLFGGEQEGSLFSGARSAPSTFLSDRRPVSSASGPRGVVGTTTTRKRSLKGGRKTEEMLELTVTRIQLRLDVFNEDELQPLASNAVLAFGDLEILDYISTSQIRKIICYWKSDVTHPRESGSSMVHVHLTTVRPGPNLCEEHRLRVRILPLRINLDQEVVNFLRQFVPKEDPTVRRRMSSTTSRGKAPFVAGAGEPELDSGIDTTPHGAEGTEMSVMNLSPHVNETAVTLNGWFFQSIDIRPCKIKIDYRPNHVDYAALRAGDYLEVINLFVLEGMELVLRRVKMSGVDGWPALGEQVLMSWVNDISRHQIHKCVASVSMPPLRPFANIGSGAADLILLPMEHYNRDRRVVRGIKKGAKSFLKSVTIETLNTVSKVAQGTQALLEHADDAVSTTSAHRRRQMKYRQAGSRIKRNSRTMGGGGIRSAQDTGGGIGGRQYLTQQPSNATEGLYQAYDSLSRELHVAAKTIVAVPLVEYKKTGSQGYVRSVIRAVPVAVLRPMIGATEAVSKALIGVRNAVDPELKEDIENKFKDFGTY